MSTANQPAKPAATPPGDAKLISAARRGDSDAFATLLSRHQDAGMKMARRLAPNAASEVYDAAVENVEGGLRAGTGPKVAFRPYLLTAVRRANYERARSAGKIRPTDELAANKVLLISSSSVSAELLGQTTLAYRELTEVQQLALWHTEVDGEPFLDTGLLLGISGTEVAELAFGARDELRKAMIGTQLDSAASGPCRWTCDRLGAHVRRRLTPTIAEKVRSHLEHCTSCRELVPAVTAMEAEMQSLIAMVVLGAAAGPYLDMDSVPARGRKVAAMAAAAGDDEVVARAGFFSGHRKAAFAGVGAIIAAAGLFGGLSMASNSGTENTASDAGAPAAQLPGALDDFEAGPDDAPVAAGSGSAGTAIKNTTPRHAKTYTGDTELIRSDAPRSAPKHAKPTTTVETGEPKSNASKKPAASQKPTEKPEETPADNGKQTLALGPLGDLELTPNAGLLGILPAIELAPPAA